MLACALGAGNIVIFEHIHPLATEHDSMFVGCCKGVCQILLIAKPIASVFRLSVYDISGDAYGGMILPDEWDIVPACAVSGGHRWSYFVWPSVAGVDAMVFKYQWLMPMFLCA